MTNLAAIAATVAEVTPGHHKPTLVCQMALGEIEETLAIWSKAKLPHYHFPEEAARSLGAMARYAANIHRDRYEVKTFADVDRDRVKEVLRPRQGGGPEIRPGARGPRNLPGLRLPGGSLRLGPECG